MNGSRSFAGGAPPADLATKADDSAVVHLAGAETITGVKAFSALPTGAADPSTSAQLARKGYVDAGDALAAQLTGATFTGDVIVATDASFRHLGSGLGFYGATAATKQTISGSRGGNAALADLLTKLAALGLITDSTTA